LSIVRHVSGRGQTPRKAAPSPLADEADYSGRFVMRIPKRLHADLAKSAKRQGVSLNQ